VAAAIQRIINARKSYKEIHMNRSLSARLGFALILALILCAVPVVAFAQGDTPSVTVTDQDSDGSSVTIDSVVAAVPGWIVIHLDNNGSPGPVIGQSAVEVGDNGNVTVSLDPALDADTSLWAMLHVDEGVVGTYEFPGPDVPVRDGDMIVMTPFVASVGAGEDDMAATEAVTDTAEIDATEATTETEEIGETEAMTDTEAATETEELAETEAVTDTAEIDATEAMTDTEATTEAEDTTAAADLGETETVTDTEGTAEAADMGETEAMTDTADVADTTYLTETEDMADTADTTTEAAGADDTADTAGDDTATAAPEVLPTTGAGLGGVAQALPAALATLGALAGGVWISRRRRS
jgi:hypothetical protein